jgi:phage portal protein BeeE
MRIFGLNITIPRSSPPVAKAFDPYADAWLHGDVPDYPTPALTNAYEQVVWVYRAINVLAEQIGNIPFLFSNGERGRENLVTSGPLIDFYDQPHPQINRFQYWELRLIWLMLRGECFRIPVFSDSTPPPHNHNLNLTPTLTPAHPRLLRVIIPDPAHFHHIVEDHQLIGWRYTGFGRETPLASQVFLPEEVWFEKLSNPFNFWRGLGPLRVAALAAQTDFAAGSFMKGVMENNGDLGLVVRMKEQTSPEQREQLKAALRARKRRAGTADNPLLLWNTSEVVQPHLSSGDLQFLENRKFSRSEICAAFGVPEEIVTTTDNSKYDVVSGARLNFIEHRVGPLCRRLEAGEDVTVKALMPGAVGWFDLDSLPIMQKAQRDRLATARSVFDMGVPFNELNRVLDLGFKKLPWGNRGYVAANLAEVGADASAGQRKMDDPSSTSCLQKNGKLEPPDLLNRFYGLLEQLHTSQSDNPNEGIPIPIKAVVSAPSQAALAPEQTFDAQLINRFRRFFFEQRGRVLAKLANAETLLSADGTAAHFLDLTAETEQLELLKLPREITADKAERIRRFLSQELVEVSIQLCDSLNEGVRLQETREELAERVRRIYNEKSKLPISSPLSAIALATAEGGEGRPALQSLRRRG